MESTLTVKGQTTIPKAIREQLRLRPGSRVKYFIHPDGTVVLAADHAGNCAAGLSRHMSAR